MEVTLQAENYLDILVLPGGGRKAWSSDKRLFTYLVDRCTRTQCFLH